MKSQIALVKIMGDVLKTSFVNPNVPKSNQIKESPGHQVEGERVEETGILILGGRKLKSCKPYPPVFGAGFGEDVD